MERCVKFPAYRVEPCAGLNDISSMHLPSELTDAPAWRVVTVVKAATDITAQKLRNAEFEGKINAIGRAQAVKVFEPLGLPGEPMPPRYANYPKAMQLLHEKKWAEAHDLFAAIKDDHLSEKYAGRCAELRDGKLADWDGIWNLTEKG